MPLHERQDQGTELDVGAVEARLVKVTYMAPGGTSPHPHPLVIDTSYLGALRRFAFGPLNISAADT